VTIDLEEKFLSERVKSVQESQTLAIGAKAQKMKAEGHDVIALSAGEPDFPTPDFICAAAIQAIKENFTKYTPVPGIPALRKAIADKLQKDNNLSYKPEQIIVSNGGKQALINIFLAVCNPGDEVIMQAPYWVSYPEMAHLADAIPVIINSDINSDFKITPEQLEKAITEKTKIFVFNSPSNPTGTVYSEEEIRALMAVLANRKDILIISDEIYEYLVYDQEKHFSPAQIPEIADRVVTVNGVSKAYSMTGWRIGYAAGPKWLIDACIKIQSQVSSNPASISQKAALAAITGDQSIISEMKKAFVERRDFLYQELNKIKGLRVNSPKGAFYMLISVEDLLGKTLAGHKINSAYEFAGYLLEKHYLAVVPGEAFGADGYIRISYADSMETLSKAVDRFKNAINLE